MILQAYKAMLESVARDAVESKHGSDPPTFGGRDIGIPESQGTKPVIVIQSLIDGPTATKGNGSKGCGGRCEDRNV